MSYFILRKLIFICLLTVKITFAQESINLIIYGGLNTSSSVYPYPSASESIIRNIDYKSNNLFYPGISIDYEFDEHIELRLNIEYISQKVSLPVTVMSGNKTVSVLVGDNYYIIPLEGGVNYYFPFSGSVMSFYMSAGAGVYFSGYNRSIGSLELENKFPAVNMNIFVAAGLDYRIYSNILLNFEMKFREPEIIIENNYKSISGTINGAQFELGKREFQTKTNLSGIAYRLGLKWELN